MSKSQHGKHVANVQRKIARHLSKGDPCRPGSPKLWQPCVERATLAPGSAPEHAATRGAALTK